MKAAVVTRYGPPEVVELRELPDPRPRPGEVLVGVHVSTVTAADWRIRRGTVPRGFGTLLRLALGWRAPRHAVLGIEVAGEILALGEGVSRFAVGDRVFAMSGARMGGHAQLAVLKASGAIAPIAPGISFETAAALPFGGTAAHYFLKDKGRVKCGDHVLINGASGGVGSAAIQLALHFSIYGMRHAHRRRTKEAVPHAPSTFDSQPCGAWPTRRRTPVSSVPNWQPAFAASRASERPPWDRAQCGVT